MPRSWTDVWVGVAGLVLVLIQRLLSDWRSRAAQSWPVADGTVESTAVRNDPLDNNEGPVYEVNYSYKAYGEYYAGAHQVETTTEFELFPVRSRVVVHYDPKDPSKSFLDREDLRSRKERIAAQGV